MKDHNRPARLILDSTAFVFIHRFPFLNSIPDGSGPDPPNTPQRKDLAQFNLVSALLSR
jgi:hypothetical protein